MFTLILALVALPAIALADVAQERKELQEDICASRHTFTCGDPVGCREGEVSRVEQEHRWLRYEQLCGRYKDRYGSYPERCCDHVISREASNDKLRAFRKGCTKAFGETGGWPPECRDLGGTMKRARSTYEQRVSDAASSLEVIDRFGQVTPEQRQSFYNNLDAACAEFTETMPPQWEAPAACDQFESGRPAVTSKLTKEENRLLNLAMIRQAGQTSERQADLCNIYFRMYGKVWPVECEAIEPPAW